MKNFIPNLFTLSNLACGLAAGIVLFNGDIILAAWLVGLSLVFDFLDGMAARLLEATSELGKQLDSLADMVSFGVVPGLLMFKLFEVGNSEGGFASSALPYFGLLIPIFSALRLAKFNIDIRQAHYFIGLPTPANTIFLFSIGLTAIYGSNPAVKDFLLHPVFLILLTIAASVLLIAEIPLLSLKLKSMRWNENKGLYILLLVILVLAVVFGLQAIVFIIPLYILISLIFKPSIK